MQGAYNFAHRRQRRLGERSPRRLFYFSERGVGCMSTVPEYFGSLVFDDRVMKAKLPYDVYVSLKKTMYEGGTLDTAVANAVADAMKEWAVEKGATHFTHWFQPLTGSHRREARQLHHPRRRTATSSWSFPARSSSGASRTLPAFPPAGCALRLRRAATPPGTRQPTPLSRTTRSASRRPSAPTAARRSTRKRRCCAPCRPLNKQALRILKPVRQRTT